MFKTFTFQVILRVILILINLVVFAFIFGDERLFFNQVILFLLLCIQVAELIRYVSRTNRELAKFLLAIKHSDFSISFNKSRLGGSFKDLDQAFSEIIKTYKSTTTDKEVQYQYLQQVVSHVSIGILSIEEDGTISLVNHSAQQLLDVEDIRNWKILHTQLPNFCSAVDQIEQDGRRLIELKDDEQKKLSVQVTTIHLPENNYRLVTFQDIQNEINQKEIEAWHKLIRILTHEIMNSATPISSLTETMQAMLKKDNQLVTPTALTEETIEDLSFSLQTIQKRSDGMLAFIDDYRKITKVPHPKPEKVEVQSLFQRIQTLTHADLKKNGIALKTNIENVSDIILDPRLIEQVLLNLIKNSQYALTQTTTPEIQLLAYMEGQRFVIEVRDNGSGIEEKELQEIFIPFFTTKKDGSGIGLSLSRQIMHLHGGTLTAHSEPQKTSFYLRFKKN